MKKFHAPIARMKLQIYPKYRDMTANKLNVNCIGDLVTAACFLRTFNQTRDAAAVGLVNPDWTDAWVKM